MGLSMSFMYHLRMWIKSDANPFLSSVWGAAEYGRTIFGPERPVQ